MWGWTGTTTRGGLVTGGVAGTGTAPADAGTVATGACAGWAGVTTDAGDVERVPGKAWPTYAANPPTSATAPAASHVVVRVTRGAARRHDGVGSYGPMSGPLGTGVAATTDATEDDITAR